MEFDEVIDVILEYHYSMIRRMLEESRQRDFIQCNDKCEAAREIIKKIISKLPEEKKRRYSKATREKMDAFAQSIFFIKREEG